MSVKYEHGVHLVEVYRDCAFEDDGLRDRDLPYRCPLGWHVDNAVFTHENDGDIAKLTKNTTPDALPYKEVDAFNPNNMYMYIRVTDLTVTSYKVELWEDAVLKWASSSLSTIGTKGQQITYDGNINRIYIRLVGAIGTYAKVDYVVIAGYERVEVEAQDVVTNEIINAVSGGSFNVFRDDTMDLINTGDFVRIFFGRQGGAIYKTLSGRVAKAHEISRGKERYMRFVCIGKGRELLRKTDKKYDNWKMHIDPYHLEEGLYNFLQPLLQDGVITALNWNAISNQPVHLKCEENAVYLNVLQSWGSQYNLDFRVDRGGNLRMYPKGYWTSSESLVGTEILESEWVEDDYGIINAQPVLGGNRYHPSVNEEWTEQSTDILSWSYGSTGISGVNILSVSAEHYSGNYYGASNRSLNLLGPTGGSGMTPNYLWVERTLATPLDFTKGEYKGEQDAEVILLMKHRTGMISQYADEEIYYSEMRYQLTDTSAITIEYNIPIENTYVLYQGNLWTQWRKYRVPIGYREEEHWSGDTDKFRWNEVEKIKVGIYGTNVGLTYNQEFMLDVHRIRVRSFALTVNSQSIKDYGRRDGKIIVDISKTTDSACEVLSELTVNKYKDPRYYFESLLVNGKGGLVTGEMIHVSIPDITASSKMIEIENSMSEDGYWIGDITLEIPGKKAIQCDVGCETSCQMGCQDACEAQCQVGCELVCQVSKEISEYVPCPLISMQVVKPDAPTGFDENDIATGTKTEPDTGALYVYFEVTIPRVSDALYYVLRYRIENETEWQYRRRAQEDVGVDIKIVLARVLSKTTYDFALASEGSYGYRSDWTATVQKLSAEDTTYPAPPDNLTATTIPGGVRLQWSYDGDPPADLGGFAIYYNTSNTHSGETKVAVVNKDQYEWKYMAISEAEFNQTRYFWIKAIDWSGNYSTTYSPVDSTTVGYIPGGGIAPDSIGATLLKIGMKPWNAECEFYNIDNDTVGWRLPGGGSPKIYFADGSDKTVNAGNTGNLSDGVHFIYFDTTSTLKVTQLYGNTIGNDNGLLATILIDAGNDNKPSIFPFNSYSPTIGTGYLAVGAVHAEHITLKSQVGGDWGVVLQTDISSGHIKLSSTEQTSVYKTVTSGQETSWTNKPETMDEIGDGPTTWSKVYKTDIAAGHLKLTAHTVTQSGAVWYNEGGVKITAGVGIQIYGPTGNALTTRKTEDGDIQCYVGTDGQIMAGGGSVRIDANGIAIKGQSLRFYDGETLCGYVKGDATLGIMITPATGKDIAIYNPTGDVVVTGDIRLYPTDGVVIKNNQAFKGYNAAQSSRHDIGKISTANTCILGNQNMDTYIYGNDEIHMSAPLGVKIAGDLKLATVSDSVFINNVQVLKSQLASIEHLTEVGSQQDSVSRAAINLILSRMETHGMIATPS